MVSVWNSQLHSRLFSRWKPRRTGAPLAPPERATFYTEGPRGYLDYPALA